jgi:hypothetical protein
MTTNDTPLVLRFLAKIVLDVLPAALASVIGGFLISHSHWDHWGLWAAAVPIPQQHAEASAEMMKMVRDEHSLMGDFISTELKAEKNRIVAADQPAAEKETPHPSTVAAIETKPATPVPPRRPAVAIYVPQVRPMPTREPAAPVSQRETASAPAPYKVAALPAYPAPPAAAPVVIDPTAPRPPLALIPAQPDAAVGPSLITRAIDRTVAIKDGVVDATRRALGAIEGVPSWFGPSAEHASEPTATSAAASHLVSVD